MNEEQVSYNKWLEELIAPKKGILYEGRTEKNDHYGSGSSR